MRIAGINGINTDGRSSTDLLLASLADEGYETIDVEYPHTRFWNAGWRNTQLDRASRIMEQTQNGDAVVAHSFGCLLTRRAMQLGREFSYVFLFSPADASDTYYPISGAKEIFVIFNLHDKAIRLGGLLPNHDFGALGRYGYRGPRDPRIENVPMPSFRTGSSNHGPYFEGEQLHFWTEFIKAHVPGWKESSG